MDEWIRRPGFTPEILKDPAKRAMHIDAYNAEVGGLRKLMRGGRLEIAPTAPIQASASKAQILSYLKYIASGKRVPIVFAAGRATRMKLPAVFDRLGLAGLNARILERLNSLREGEDAPIPSIMNDAELGRYVEEAAAGKISSSKDLSLLQRILIQYRCQTEGLIAANPESGLKFQDWLSKASFAVVANAENRAAAAKQLAAVKFAGLDPKNIFLLVQPEEGGWRIDSGGALKAFDRQKWPEGHGKPFLDMRSEPSAAHGVDKHGTTRPLGKTLYDALRERGVERVVFAQVNDLHLLEDMAHTERWLAADGLIAAGAEMVMEMVDNGLKQKGGGIFSAPDGNTVMRDTIAMKAPDLEIYSIPKTLSRMFYELTLSGVNKLREGALPAYITERKAGAGEIVLTREFYSGDASGVLRAGAISRPGYELFTFKTQSRIPLVLQAIEKQNSQKDFNLFITGL
jgi:hypothetical protein